MLVESNHRDVSSPLELVEKSDHSAIRFEVLRMGHRAVIGRCAENEFLLCATLEAGPHIEASRWRRSDHDNALARRAQRFDRCSEMLDEQGLTHFGFPGLTGSVNRDHPP